MSEITVHNPQELNETTWLDLQALSHESFAHDLDRTTSEIDELVGTYRSDEFYQSHVDPNNEVGKHYTANQEFRHPKVAVARQDGDIVGFAYSAHNTSGPNEMIREAKRLSIVKNYLWLREVIVDPKYRGQGTGTRLTQALLRDETTIPLQPVATYIWPSEMPAMQPRLEKLGFKSTGDQLVSLFSPTTEVVQTRMQARTVRGLLGSLSVAKSTR